MDENEVALTLVTAFNKPEVLRAVKDSYYLHSIKLPSPMGMFLTAFKNKAAAEEAKAKYGGEVMNWELLLKKYDSFK
jgi:copper chaperone NosL